MPKRNRINAMEQKQIKKNRNKELGSSINYLYNVFEESKDEEYKEDKSIEFDDLWTLRRKDNVNYIRVDNVIHDKSCRQLEYIPENVYIQLERYDRTLCQCEDCALRSYVRLGCKDFDRITFYEKIYKQGRIPNELLRELYLDNAMTTYFDQNNLHICYKGDNWYVVFAEYLDFKKGVLCHNNYKVLPDGNREIIEGFHPQVSDNIFTYEILNLIKSYSYEEHKKSVLEKSDITYREKSTLVDKTKKPTLSDSDNNGMDDSVKYLDEIVEEINNNPYANRYETLEAIANVCIKIVKMMELMDISMEDLEMMVALRKKYIK